VLRHGGDRHGSGAVKNFLQEQVDRLFYGERYDLRNSLLDFGRTLSATTALDSAPRCTHKPPEGGYERRSYSYLRRDKHSPSGYCRDSVCRPFFRSNSAS